MALTVNGYKFSNISQLLEQVLKWKNAKNLYVAGVIGYTSSYRALQSGQYRLGSVV